MQQAQEPRQIPRRGDALSRHRPHQGDHGRFRSCRASKGGPPGLLGQKQKLKARVKTDYLGDVFCKGQNYIGNTDVKAIQKAYTYAIGTITGNRKRVAAAAVATLAVTAATAGGALFFAPEIAVLIAGDAVVGLSGAALTSASLAFVGGGSLAVS